MHSTSDELPAFFAAAAAPAVITGLFFLAWGGPAAFFLGLFFAFIFAGLHVALLALPLHALLSLRRAPGPLLVLTTSFLIGALPLPLLFGLEELWTGFVVFGLLGLSGGIAFVLTSIGPAPDEEGG